MARPLAQTQEMALTWLYPHTQVYPFVSQYELSAEARQEVEKYGIYGDVVAQAKAWIVVCRALHRTGLWTENGSGQASALATIQRMKAMAMEAGVLRPEDGFDQEDDDTV